MPPRTHEESLELLETFMSNWSHLVGDPVISKWIVLALAVSVFLNGYLLKGLATSVAAGQGPLGVTFASSVGTDGRGVDEAQDDDVVNDKTEVLWEPKK